MQLLLKQRDDEYRSGSASSGWEPRCQHQPASRRFLALLSQNGKLSKMKDREAPTSARSTLLSSG